MENREGVQILPEYLGDVHPENVNILISKLYNINRHHNSIGKVLDAVTGKKIAITAYFTVNGEFSKLEIEER